MNRQQGFTLIEIMIVVAILAIIAALAIPSYSDYMARTRRGTAAACLLEVGQLVERYYTKNLTYELFTIPTAPKMECQKALEDYYAFDFNEPVPTVGYTVTATPTPNQLAQDKNRCGTLTLDGRGGKTISATSPPSPSATSCWAGKAS
jgi:type IV pilus assembly protein PilE